jgi:hypothetical protein
MGVRKRSALTASKLRSAITNGHAVLADTDHRTAWMRRVRDLLHAHAADLGGDDTMSEGQRAIMRRAVMLQVQCEMLEQKFAANGGSASAKDLDLYNRASANLKRLLESLGLHHGRKPRDITQQSDDIETMLQDYLHDDAEAVP